MLVTMRGLGAVCEGPSGPGELVKHISRVSGDVRILNPGQSRLFKHPDFFVVQAQVGRRKQIPKGC